MALDQKTKKIIWISLAALIIVLLVTYYLRYQNLKKQIGITDPVKNASSVIPPDSTGGTVYTPPLLAYHGTDFTRWKYGDVITAVAPVVNVYASTAITSSGIQDTFTAGDAIGSFQSLESGFAIVKYIKLNYLFFPVVKTGYIYLSANNVTS